MIRACSFAILAIPLTAYGIEIDPAQQDQMHREVRLELMALPGYSVFDNVAFRVNGTQVTLTGQVVQAALKTDAANAVNRVDGVTAVLNQIEILPPSSKDDEIRQAEYRAVYNDPELRRYAVQAIPPIHIIVKNGSVTLEGSVAADMDRERVCYQAGTVPGIGAVKNDLRIDAAVLG
jgi:hyperosmotically inducible periplasmic protein